MRKKIARKLRKDALRRGAILSNEKPCCSRKELRAQGWKRGEAGFGLELTYLGRTIFIYTNSELECYRTTLEVMDELEEWKRDGEA